MISSGNDTWDKLKKKIKYKQDSQKVEIIRLDKRIAPTIHSKRHSLHSKVQVSWRWVIEKEMPCRHQP